jgi:1-phosphatidylinositol-3-phosphate 5-kinase
MPEIDSCLTSSRSIVLSRPQLAGHKRLHSEYNLLGRLKGTSDNRIPFRKRSGDDIRGKAELPAFHDDHIIDPELAAYMSE